jgi:hypothetical protein
MAEGVTTHRAAWTVPGTDEWTDENAEYTRKMLRDVEGDCALVADKLPHFRAWAKSHDVAWEQFCGERLGAPAGFLDKIEEGVSVLRSKGHGGPITKEQAVAAVAAQAVPQRSHADAVRESAKARTKKGTKGFKTQSSNGDNITKAVRGTDADYLTARIARDAPAVLERMKAGEFKSVRAAAIAAGVVKPPDPVKGLVKAVRKLDTTKRLAVFSALVEAFPNELRWAR